MRLRVRISMALATVAAASMGLAQTATAAPITFFGQDQAVFLQSGAPTGAGMPNSTAAEASFLATLVGVGTESFESFADNTTSPLPISFPGAGTATLVGGGAVDDDPGTGQNAVHGTKWWRTGASNDFTINFSNPVAAFGFYGIDVGDINSQLSLTLVNASGSVVVNIPHSLGGAQNGSVIFFGYTDTANPWTQAIFTNPAAGDDFGFDRMTIGSVDQVQQTPVPEPGTVALLGGGMALLLVARSRRRR